MNGLLTAYMLTGIQTIIIVIVLAAGGWVYWLVKKQQDKVLEEEALRHRKLSDKLRMLYQQSAAGILLYDRQGKLVRHVTDCNTAFSIENILDGDFLDNSLKEQLQNGQTIRKQVEVTAADTYSLSFLGKKVFEAVVVPLQNTGCPRIGFIMFVTDLSPVMRQRIALERFDNLLDFASEFSQMGLAFYNISTGEITATRYWYTNLCEEVRPGALPTYQHVIPEDRAGILQFHAKVNQGIYESFIGDIRVVDEKGHEHWIRQYIYTNISDKNVLVGLNINIDAVKKEELKLLEARMAAETATRHTREFMEDINNRIRTPLKTIAGFSAFQASGIDTQECSRHARSILRAYEQLADLVDDISKLPGKNPTER